MNVIEKDASTNIIDISEEVKRAEAIKTQIAIRTQAMVELIMRQTDYTDEMTRTKLKLWENNYLNVIKEYMNPNFQVQPEEKSSTKNQMIYGEIRNFMDDVNKQQLQRKRRTEYIEQKRAAYLSHMQKNKKENN